jgi:ATP-dependent Clp protease ATP-binding subunit ClpA
MKARSLGFGERPMMDPAKAKAAIERAFAPEFRNRLDSVVTFSGLTADVILKVVDKEVRLLQGMLDEKGVKVQLTDAARKWLSEKGYDPEFGARPMGRLVDQALKKPLAEALLFGSLKHGGSAIAELKSDGSGLELTFANAQA